MREHAAAPFWSGFPDPQTAAAAGQWWQRVSSGDELQSREAAITGLWFRVG